MSFIRSIRPLALSSLRPQHQIYNKSTLSIATFHSSSIIKMTSTSQHTNRPTVLSELAPVFTSMHDAKVQKQLSFEEISKKLNRSEWYTAAIFYGQAKPEEKDLKSLSEILGIPFDQLNDVMGQHFFPTRGLGQFPPQDPTIYRLYECLVVYGHPLKAMIHEKFGDGIMSLIDFTGDMERVSDPNGDRVKITLNGKFLPYKRW